MIVLDRLLEIGNHRCPCGASIAPRENAFARVLIECSECSSYCGGDDEISAFVTWLVLTGGPISGEVPPPTPDWYDVRINGEWTDVGACWWGGRWLIDDEKIEMWQLKIHYRTPAIIRPWLESEVTT